MRTTHWMALLLVFSLAGNVAAGPHPLTAEDRDYLRGIMRETWHFLDFYISPKTGLPYDSSTPNKDITNTTTIGVYLASLCMAYKMNYVTEDHALARIERILDSLDTLEHWNRLYNNWLHPDLKTREAQPGRNNISDYNKLPAGLILVRQTFPRLESRITAFLNEIPWAEFHDPETDKVLYEFDVVQRKTLNPVYLFRGEDKVLGLFFMIASEQVPPEVWDRQDNATEERHGYRYFRHGWQGGGLFMHFFCSLFLDPRGTPLEESARNFTLAQKAHAEKIGAPVWGWSACEAPDGRYLGMDAITDEIVTPHASALAIHLFPREVTDNLRRLETFGLREPFPVDGEPQRFGFRDSVNWKTGEVADVYLVLDQAMLFLALINVVEDELLWRTFGADPMVRRGRELIPDYP